MSNARENIETLVQAMAFTGLETIDKTTLIQNRELSKRTIGRAARRNPRKADRNFEWWEEYGNALIAARGEAMRAAYTDQPIGKAYNHELNKILRREKLVVVGKNGHFPDVNTRKDAVAMIENLHYPVDARRREGILTWRAKHLTESERQRLNHPTAILRRWRKDTEPIEEKPTGRTAAVAGAAKSVAGGATGAATPGADLEGSTTPAGSPQQEFFRRRRLPADSHL